MNDSKSNPSVQYNEWRRTLYFYEKELDLLKKRILDAAEKNNIPEAQKGIALFQKQLMVKYSKIESLKNEINELAHQVTEPAASKRKEVAKIDDKDQKITTSMLQLEKMLNELRHKFNDSLLEWAQKN